MYRKIMVAYDESPQAKRALASGIELAKQLGSELHVVTVSEPLPAYAAYVEAAFPGTERTLANERIAYYGNLQKEAKEQAELSGVSAEGAFSKAMKFRLSSNTFLRGTQIFS